MKIFLDTASIDDIKQFVQFGIIDGVTTNPTHLYKAGKAPLDTVKEITSLLKNGVISVEVTEEEPDAVYQQAKRIAHIAPNVVVKVPCHEKYYEVINKLVQEEVPLNITLVFSLLQSLMMCKLGVRYISPFVGRLDDIDADGSGLLHDLRQMVDTYNFKTQILAASIRSVDDFHQAVMAGADVVTLPTEVLRKALQHPLTDKGMKLFLDDWRKLGYKSFA
ncbi:MAG: transaldolase family protein [Candidatus Dependentiae bacterium]